MLKKKKQLTIGSEDKLTYEKKSKKQYATIAQSTKNLNRLRLIKQTKLKISNSKDYIDFLCIHLFSHGDIKSKRK